MCAATGVCDAAGSVRSPVADVHTSTHSTQPIDPAWPNSQHPPPQSAAASATAHPLPCLMTGALARDIHARHSFILLCDFDTLMNLVTTSHQWYEWITTPPEHLLRDITQLFQSNWNDLKELSQSKLIRTYCTKLDVQLQFFENDRQFERAQKAWEATPFEPFESIARFPRVQRLKLVFGTDMENKPLFFHQPSLLLIGHNLIKLELELRHFLQRKLSFLRQIFSPLASFPKLRYISVEPDFSAEQSVETVHGEPTHMDFSPLLHLKDLTYLRFPVNYYRCDQTDCDILSQLTQIQQLSCGSWSIDKSATSGFKPTGGFKFGSRGRRTKQEAVPSTPSSSRTPFATSVEFLAGLIRFVNGRTNPPADPTSATLPIRPLRSFNLTSTDVDSGIFDQILRLKDLYAIQPKSWSNNITQEQWNKLSDFKSLEALNIFPEMSSSSFFTSTPSFTSEKFWAAVTQCPTLKLFNISHFTVTTDQLTQLVHSCPHLTHLSFNQLKLESLQPLSLAHELRQLRLCECTTLQSTDLEIRLNLPHLPSLTQLTLKESLFLQLRLTRERVNELNQEMFKRLPKLNPRLFFQQTPAV